MKKITYILSVLTVIFSCSPESTDTSALDSLSADVKGKIEKNGGSPQEALDAPALECGTATTTNLELTITAGASGAAGGFDIHWMTEAEFIANESEWIEGTFCEKGFAGNGSDVYSLAPNESISLNLEDLVAAAECGTVECAVSYVFRVRAKNEGGQGQQGGLKKSNWSENFTCATQACACTYGKGFWKNHSNANPGEQEDLWPVKVLTLGSHEYTQIQLNEILDIENNEGNNLVIFSQHLIAAKLNVANGAGNPEIEATILGADEMIGGLVILVDSFPEGIKSQVNTVKDILEAYNESIPCEE